MEVKVHHLRRNNLTEVLLTKHQISEKGGTVIPTGGMTVAVLAEDKETFAVARCSNEDTYSKKIGRAIAEGRLRKRLEARR